MSAGCPPFGPFPGLITPSRRRWLGGRGPAQGRIPSRDPPLECVQVDQLPATLEVVEEHPAPFHSFLFPADDDIFQIVAPVQPGQGQNEMGVGYDQVQIDIVVAVQLYSAVKGIILEDMVFSRSSWMTLAVVTAFQVPGLAPA